MKTITICDKNFDIDCNALTYIQFRKVFNRGIFQDIQVIENFIVQQSITTKKIMKKDSKISEPELVNQLSRVMLENIDEYIEAVTRITYICVYTANNNIGAYEDWLKEIKRINTNDSWIAEVTEFAVNCFC